MKDGGVGGFGGIGDDDDADDDDYHNVDDDDDDDDDDGDDYDDDRSYVIRFGFWSCHVCPNCCVVLNVKMNKLMILINFVLIMVELTQLLTSCEQWTSLRAKSLYQPTLHIPY